MKIKIQQSDERGHANLEWLNSYHSFSFGSWHDPAKMNFGALRVLNDDSVDAGQGFGTHPHDNMEIVSIPLSGTIAHKDSTGTDGLIKTGDVQIMSAGTGIRHSEFNPSKEEGLKFLQIWVMPKKRKIEPRYDQKSFKASDRQNKWQVVVSPDEKDEALWINQDCVFSLANITAGNSLSYSCKFPGNGTYLFVIEGSVEIMGQSLQKRDAAGISDADSFEVKANEDSYVLCIEVPM
ncbi:pirin family protein [soil metagenome]